MILKISSNLSLITKITNIELSEQSPSPINTEIDQDFSSSSPTCDPCCISDKKTVRFSTAPEIIEDVLCEDFIVDDNIPYGTNAAKMSCLRTFLKLPFSLSGGRYMVVDCGGGTVDITVHEITNSEGQLKELFKATGGPYGSVSEYYLQFLSRTRVTNVREHS